MLVNAIVAVGLDGAMGHDGGLPWPKIPADMARFVQLTKGHTVVMGRKTHETLPTTLPKRNRIVLSRDRNFPLEKRYPGDDGTGGLVSAWTWELVLAWAEQWGSKEIFLLGGASLFSSLANHVDIWYLTVVQERFTLADVIWPFYTPEMGVLGNLRLGYYIESEEQVPIGKKTLYPLTFYVLRRYP